MESRGIRTALALRAGQLLTLAHSSIMPVPSGLIDESARWVASIAAAAGFTPVLVSTSAGGEHSFDGGHEFVFVIPLHEPITQRIARSLKFVADDFRSNRVGIVLPNGQVIDRRIQVRCAIVIPSCSEFKNWPADLLRSFIEYYSVSEFCD